jgi:hypothetical protein
MLPTQPAQTRSSRRVHVACENQTVAQSLASIPNTPEIRFAIRVFITPSAPRRRLGRRVLAKTRTPKQAEDRLGNKIMPKPAAKPTVTTDSLNSGPVFATPVAQKEGLPSVRQLP